MKSVAERVYKIRHWFIDHRDLSENLVQNIKSKYIETVGILKEGSELPTQMRPVPSYSTLLLYFENHVAPSVEIIISADLTNFDAKMQVIFSPFLFFFEMF